jgi:hypothetical protein
MDKQPPGKHRVLSKKKVDELGLGQGTPQTPCTRDRHLEIVSGYSYEAAETYAVQGDCSSCSHPREPASRLSFCIVLQLEHDE